MATKKTETKKVAPAKKTTTAKTTVEKTTAPAKPKRPAAKKPAPEKKPVELPTMESFPSLKKNSKETGYITLLQTNLKNRGYYDGPVDGKYGDNTEKAVMEFQKDLGKPISGTVGPKTWEQLKTSNVVRVKAPVAPPPPVKPNIKVIIEGLNRYQADLLVKLFSESMDCHIVQ